MQAAATTDTMIGGDHARKMLAAYIERVVKR
jgi:hypothetical protein